MRGIEDSDLEATHTLPEPAEFQDERSCSPAQSDDLRPLDPALSAQIAHAHAALARAERRLSRMQMSLRGVKRTAPEFGDLLPLLPVLERSSFNKRFELDALLREGRRSSAQPALRAT